MKTADAQRRSVRLVHGVHRRSAAHPAPQRHHLTPVVAGREATPSDAASTERLMTYWAHGPGAAKINWGVPGDFARCELELGKYVSPTVVKGLCSNLHVRATGARPGHAPGEHH